MYKFKKGDKVILLEDYADTKIGNIGIIKDITSTQYASIGPNGKSCKQLVHIKMENNCNVVCYPYRVALVKINLEEDLRFDVTDNPELSAAIQSRLIELGYHRVLWVTHTRPTYIKSPLITLSKGIINTWSQGTDDKTIFFREITLNDLYNIKSESEPVTLNHVIKFDDKEIEISDKSYQAFKAQFQE